MCKIQDFEIEQSKPISAAYKKMSKNLRGIVLVVDKDRKVIGVATDGDIRRFLTENPDLGLPISSCMNPDFVSVPENSPRENVLRDVEKNKSPKTLVN